MIVILIQYLFEDWRVDLKLSAHNIGQEIQTSDIEDVLSLSLKVFSIEDTFGYIQTNIILYDFRRGKYFYFVWSHGSLKK